MNVVDPGAHSGHDDMDAECRGSSGRG